ncbi:hypothetical protein BC829DRAFT_424083 [Chytridium lagenaria]|nr:hypothetical protein BC829DRAFT_424083 [Chytridium lagenaria]
MTYILVKDIEEKSDDKRNTELLRSDQKTRFFNMHYRNVVREADLMARKVDASISIFASHSSSSFSKVYSSVEFDKANPNYANVELKRLGDLNRIRNTVDNNYALSADRKRLIEERSYVSRTLLKEFTKLNEKVDQLINTFEEYRRGQFGPIPTPTSGPVTPLTPSTSRNQRSSARQATAASSPIRHRSSTEKIVHSISLIMEDDRKRKLSKSDRRREKKLRKQNIPFSRDIVRIKDNHAYGKDGEILSLGLLSCPTVTCIPLQDHDDMHLDSVRNDVDHEYLGEVEGDNAPTIENILRSYVPETPIIEHYKGFATEEQLSTSKIT